VGIPVIRGVRQLTADGEPKVQQGLLLTDGLRLYFAEGATGHSQIAQVSVGGGQTSALPTRFSDQGLAAIARDGSALFMGAPVEDGNHGLWRQPLPGGEPMLMPTGDTDGTAVFPDARLVFTRGPDLFIADNDGSNARKLASISGHATLPAVSPDGRLIRFTLGGDKGFYSIWQVNSDGTGLHELFKRWQDSMGEQAGIWTSDGKYFVFQVEHGGRWDLWAVRESGALFHSVTPVQLSNGPLSYEEPVASRSSNELFAIGSNKRGELIRFDARTRQFVPYLSGISAASSRMTRDGKWVVYVTYPEHTLWRCHPDGTERQQLTFLPMMAYYPEISPDGNKIAFTAATPNSLVDIYIVSMTGGAPQKVVDWGHAPAWSPDGNALAFGTLVPGAHVFAPGRWMEVHTVNLRTREITVLPSSVNQYAPWWPRQDVIVTNSLDDGSFYAFDLKSKKWSRIGNPSFYLNWTASPDGKFLYTLESSKTGTRVRRLRADNFNFEEVANAGDLRLVNDDTLGQASLDAWIGVAADGSPTLTRDVGSDEIYALDVKWP
jgi:Tol biopolymer transport system component